MLSNIRWTTLKVGSKLAEVTAPPEDPTVKFGRRLPEETAEADEARSQLPGYY
jgi:hypothetical protein